ncbi:MAG: DNA-processing protein DprA, partial [Bacillota bacterium]|nr:DNA-processing protein DprA [Bacillota bacterium]
MRDLPFWVALSKVSSLGARRIMQLVETFGSAENAFTAAADEIAAAGLPLKAADAFVTERKNMDPEALLRDVTSAGFSVITRTATGYPALLREIYDPPAVLFYRGNLDVLLGRCIAVV